MTGNVLLLTAIVAAVMTPVVSLIKRENWPTWVKYLLAVAVSALVATGEVIFNNHVRSVDQFLTLWGVAVATTQTVFHTFFGDSGLEQWLAKYPSKEPSVP